MRFVGWLWSAISSAAAYLQSFIALYLGGLMVERWNHCPGLCSVEYLMTASMQCSAVVEAAQSAAVVVSGSVGREDAVSHDPAARAGDRGLCLGELISPPPKARAGVPAVFQISNLASVFFFRAWQRNGAHRGGSSPPHRAGPRRQAHSPIHTVPPCLRTNH